MSINIFLCYKESGDKMSKKRNMLIVTSGIFVILVVICFLLVYFAFRIKEQVSYDIDEWNGLAKKFTYLPSVDEAGEYTDLKCKYLHKDFYIFQSDAYFLRVTYSNELFDRQKDYIKNNYVLQKTVVDHDEEPIERETFFKLDGFDFQMLSLKEYNLYYPKQIAFVGISEEDNAIAFVFYDDIDLDYIGSSFSDFLIEECGWE